MTMSRPPRSIALATLLLACGRGATDTNAGDYSVKSELLDEASEMISASDGGEIVVDGATLTIPAGALSEDVEISMKIYAPDPSLPENVGEQRNVFVLEPHGLSFELPVLLDYGPPADAEEVMAFAYLDESTGVWEAMPSLRGEDTSLAMLPHFSTFASQTYGNLEIWETWQCTNLRPAEGGTNLAGMVFDYPEFRELCRDVGGSTVNNMWWVPGFGADLMLNKLQETMPAYISEVGSCLADNYTFVHLACEIEPENVAQLDEAFETWKETAGHDLCPNDPDLTDPEGECGCFSEAVLDEDLVCEDCGWDTSTFQINSVQQWSDHEDNSPSCPSADELNAYYFNSWDDHWDESGDPLCVNVAGLNTDGETCGTTLRCDVNDAGGGYFERYEFVGSITQEGDYDGVASHAYYSAHEEIARCSYHISSKSPRPPRSSPATSSRAAPGPSTRTAGPRPGT